MLAACLAVLGDRPRAAGDRQLRAPARRGPRHRRSCCWRPARAHRAGHQPGTLGLAAEYVFRLAPLPLPAIRTSRTSPGCRRWPCSSTGPPGSAPVPGRHRPSCEPSPTSSGGSTGCRWPSSWRPGGCPASRWPTCTAGSTARWTCSAAADPAATPGTGRCVPPIEWSYRPAARGRTAAVPAPVGLRRRRRPRRRRTARRRARAWTRDPGSVLAHLVDASMIDAELRGRHPVPHAGDAAGVRPRPARGGRRGRDAAARGCVRWAVELTGVDRRHVDHRARSPRPTRCCAGSCRTCARRGGWPAAGATRRRGRDGRRHCSTRSPTATCSRSAAGPRNWPTTRPWPSTPAAAAVLGTAAEAAYHRGDYARAERLAARAASSAQPTTPAPGTACPRCRSRPWPAGRSPTPLEHALAAAGPGLRPGENLGVAALAPRLRRRPRRGAEPERPGARRRGVARPCARGAPTSPGEIESSAGQPGLAEQHYAPGHRPGPHLGRDLPGRRRHASGCSPSRVAAGRVREALTGYREVIDYFDRTGNWTHQWATLRNLADLLRRLDDDEPAALLDAAANGTDAAPSPSETMTTARAAIERHLL